MARIDKDLIILIGRDRENPRTHRDAFQITGGLGKMLDKHVKRNNLNKSEFIREAIAAKLEAEMPKEPLIKDEKIRKAIRAWAEANNINSDCYYENDVVFDSVEHCLTWIDTSIQFNEITGLEDLKHGKRYTIDELCGTPPEPIEPTFIDLDERIKEKEEE